MEDGGVRMDENDPNARWLCRLMMMVMLIDDDGYDDEYDD